MSSVTDQETNNISLFNLVEKYTLKIAKKETQRIEGSKIMAPFNQEIVSRFVKDVKSESVIFELKVDIVTSVGKVIESKDTATINFDEKLQNIRIKNKIGGIPVEESGLYHFSVKVKEEGETRFVEVAKIPVEISIEFEK